MAERDWRAGARRPSLYAWAAGSFHAALLVATLVAALHLAGAAGDLLGGFGTVPGAVVYLYLWALTVGTTGRALRDGGVTPAGGVPDHRGALRAALVWGGATGVLFFAPLFAVLAGVVVAGNLDAVPFVLLAGAVGGLLAAIIGAAVGAAFAVLDVALLGAAAVVTGEDGGR